MKVIHSSLVLLLLRPSTAFQDYGDAHQTQRSVQLEASCPFNKIGPALEVANSQAAARLKSWEDQYPAAEFERKYSVGVANEGEVYCDGTNEQKFCNKIYGPWGDSVPQNGTYCLWAVLEFQDPPEFGYGSSTENTSIFDSIFFQTVQSIGTLTNVQDKVKARGAVSGAVIPGVSMSEASTIPWPVASIIWKDGNKYASDWIANTHRQMAQIPGYSIDFIFRGHYKAVECDMIEPTMEANNLTMDNDFSVFFKEYWNTFSDMEDVSPKFETDECVSSCEVPPCGEATSITEDNKNTTSNAALGYYYWVTGITGIATTGVATWLMMIL